MSSGDSAYVKNDDFLNSKRVIESVSASSVQMMMANEFKGSKKSYAQYNYNDANPNIVLTYLLYKYGEDDFKRLLDDVFAKKVRIGDEIFLTKNGTARSDEKSLMHMFFTTRYDYLRIAKAMLDDWQNDTCVGKYLKTIHERRIVKTDRGGMDFRVGSPLSYAGFFHTGYIGMENRPVMSLDGYGGQTITIDFERRRIIVTQAIHDNMKYPKPGSFDWKKIVYERIKNGKPASTSIVKKPAEAAIDPEQIILNNKARQESQKKAKEYWDNYYAKIFGEASGDREASGDWGASADGSILLSEDFENLDERQLRTDDRDDHWLVKKDSDGNSMYCNKNVITTNDYAHFNLGSENWSDYSISYRMKFTPGRGGELETHIRKNSNRQGEYRSVIDSMMGYTFLKYVKGADGINKKIANGSRAPIRDKWADIQLIASGNNISYIVNGKEVASTEDDTLNKGAVMFAVTSKSELCIDDIVIKKETTKGQ
jgi:hypothetical protein